MAKHEAMDSLIVTLGLENVAPGYSEKLEALKRYIDELLNNQFEKLIGILYRMDVSESKLRHLLNSNPDKDASEMICNLMIERQSQKINSKKIYNQKPIDPGEEAW